MVAGLSFDRVAEMYVHLSAQHAFGQGLLQLRGQGLEIQGSAGPSRCNQLIQLLARDAVVESTDDIATSKGVKMKLLGCTLFGHGTSPSV